MVKRRRERIKVTPSSGNVFADIGLPEPEEELAKAQFATHIERAIKRRRLTQAKAAAVMGIDQPKVSALLNGRLDVFSSDRLMRLLVRLGQDVDVTVKATPRGRARGRIRVLGEVRA
ncbi:MAG: XRE family transcriptional regulator [Rhodospirillales bacterium]|nr:XRE family transcriptional regulator [Rhodospirillales bacterium]